MNTEGTVSNCQRLSRWLLSDNASDSETPNRARQEYLKLRALYDVSDYQAAALFLADLIQTADSETQGCAVLHVCQTLADGRERLLIDALRQSQELRQSLWRYICSKNMVLDQHLYHAVIALSQLGCEEFSQYCFEMVNQCAEKAMLLNWCFLRPLRSISDNSTTAFLKAQLARFQDEESRLFLTAALLERGEYETLHEVALAASHSKRSVRDLAVVLMGVYGTQNEYDRFCQAMGEWGEGEYLFLCDQAFNKYLPYGNRRSEMFKLVDQLRATVKRN